MKMKLIKKSMALCAAALAVGMMLTSCSSRREDTGVAYEKNMSITSAADLEGKAVAVQLRSAVDEYVVSNKLTDFPKRYENLETAAADLADKKVAAIVTDSYYARKLIADTEGLKVVEGSSVGSIEYRFLVRKADQGLVDALNQQIAAFKATKEYVDMVQTELIDGKTFAPERSKAAEKHYTLVSEPYFKPFSYEKDGKLTGLFVAAADSVANLCGADLTTQTVAEDGALAMVRETENAFCVVNYECDDEELITTEPFYTSYLEMVIRADEKKK